MSDAVIDPELGVPRAVVTESGGEVSASVAETNRIRMALGMKPLYGSAQDTTELEETEGQKMQAAAEEDAMRAKIKKSKNRRQLHKKMAGKSVAEQIADEEGGGGFDAASWVEKSRQRAKEQASAKAKELEREADALDDMEDAARRKARKGGGAGGREYSSADLKGMKVKHGASAFEEGDTQILTLADSSIIGEDGMLNDEGDLLENAALKESERRDVLSKRRRDAQRGPKGYSAYDDDEFERGPDIGGTGAAAVLRHYDEVINEGKDQKGKAAMEIGEHGVASADRRKRADEVRARLRAAAAGVEMTSARSATQLSADGKGGGPNIASEFYTADEMVAFSKPTKMRKKKKKMRKKKRRTADDDEDGGGRGGGSAGGAGGGSSSIFDNDTAGGVDSAGGHHGSRNSRGGDEGGGGAGGSGGQKEASLRQERAANYETAMNKAADRDKAVALRDAQEEAQAGGASFGGDEEGDGDAGDVILQESLKRARRLALKRAEDDAADGEEGGEGGGVAAMVEATNRRLAEGGKVEGVMSEVRRMKAEPGKEADGEGGLVFEYGDGGDALTDTSEFSRRLQTRLKEQSEEHEQNREKAEATDRITKVALGRLIKREEGGGDDDGDGDGGEGGGEAGGVDDMDVEGGAGGGGGDAKGGVKSEGGGSGAKVDLEVDAFARAEPLASGGMAHVLALMRNKGDLVQEKEESHGRSNDPGIQGGDTTELGGYHKRGVKIEYRDEFGRLLKPKEAFRQMSYKFHNTEPGLKNQAKRLRQVEAELLAKQAGSNLSAVQKQSRMQAATGKAFLTLSGGAAGRVDASAFGRDDSFKDSLTKKKRKRKKDSA